MGKAQDLTVLGVQSLFLNLLTQFI